MIELEQYKNNLDILDKLEVKNLEVDKSILYRGDINIFTKIKHQNEQTVSPLAAAVVGLNNTAAQKQNESDLIDYWTDIDAQEMYLKSKPTCYLILGKPGTGAYSLGEAMSKKLNCIHLCPRNVLIDEMDQKSSTGKCLDFNFRHNNVLQFDIIMSIIKNKLDSPAVKHRGYVISGLPLVTSSNMKYFFRTLCAEESVSVIEELLYDTICNLKKEKSKTAKLERPSPHSSITSEIEIAGEEESEEVQQPEYIEAEEVPVELPKLILDSCSEIIFSKRTYMDTLKNILSRQLNELFKLKMEPDIIIYLTSPDADLITKKSHKFINYLNNSITIDPFVINTVLEVCWPPKYTMTDYVVPHDSHVFNPKYNCKQPINFKGNSINQMSNYTSYILPLIERKLKEFDPKVVIKVDGRISTHHMMHHIMERLLLLPVKPVLIPEPLYLEEPPEDMEEFWKLVEESNVIHSGALRVNRHSSLWFNRCPVELKKRRSQRGNPRFAVSFFKHVYLLSSLDAMISFCRNPRPFLKLKYLEPTCRIIVIGTKSSGKTMISKCLSWVFDAPIISYKEFFEGEKQKKYETFSKTILSEIIATIEDTRFINWQNAELERASKLQEWHASVLYALKNYVELLTKSLQYISQDKTGEGSIFSFDVDYFKTVRDQLSFLPMLDDLQQCETALVNIDILFQYAPNYLIIETPKPNIPALGDKDVTEAISAYIIANDLQKEIEPTPEELMNEMIKVLADIDIETQKNTNFDQTYGKWIVDGFPSDPQYWIYLSNYLLLPDHTIALIENKEIELELIQRYRNIENVLKNHEERFILAKDPLIKTKLQTKSISDNKFLDIQIIIHNTINNILDSIFIDEHTENDERNPDTEMLSFFNEAIDKYREDWDNVKLKLEENFKSIIEVELDVKSDIQIVEEVLLNLRKSYYISSQPTEEDEIDQSDEDEIPKDILTYNNPQYLCEINIYCPIAYYDYGILWQGKPKFSIKYDNKMHYFSKEECSELFQRDITNYQSYNKPHKELPSLRICVIGCVGSGKTTISKHIAKELGLLHIDFTEILNIYLMPRHYKKVGRQYENSFIDELLDEEHVVEFQMDEENQNLESDILYNEVELRRILYNYFERGTPLLSLLTQKIIKKLWFQEPFVSTGIVIDGFPRLSTDIEDMVTCFCIPDLIIELESNLEMTLNHLSSKMFRTWKLQQNEAKFLIKKKIDEEKKEWLNFITTKIVIKLICDDIFQNMFISEDEPLDLTAESVIIDAHPSGSSNVDANLFKSYNEIIEEFPEPIDTSEWEKSDDARERIDARLETLYEVDYENIQNLKDIASEQKIKIVSIDATKPLYRVLGNVLLKLSDLRSRNKSFFEQTFIINCDFAEMLLSKGFYFLSKFNRMCPVNIYKNRYTIMNPYKINKHKGKVFPVIHRAYIYFVSGEDSLKKFRTNPLKYVQSDHIKSFLEYPLRIGIIGSPKSGKSVLASNLSKKYGLKYISRGTALRYTLENMHWTQLASKIIAAIREGECINSYLIMKAVKMVAIDHRTVTYGFVFDGFPAAPSEAMALEREGLYPQIIFDLSSNIDTIIENSQKEMYYDIIKIKPPYSTTYIEHRFSKWNERHYMIKNWIKHDFQNINVLNGNESRWKCLQDANNIIEEVIIKIHYYLANEKSGIVNVDVMCISNEIFQQRMSNYKNVCPLCFHENILRHSGYPVDRKGVVQFRNRFYWICNDHMNMALKHPEFYLATQKVEIPEIPTAIKTITSSLVYENGICIVTYAEHLPSQKIQMGNNNFAANFKGKMYLFCSDGCLKKFLAKPHMYYDITVFKETKILPELTLKNLPNIGYLEQTIGNIITDACCAVNVLRPKYPGLSVQLSALIYIALYLKSHNPLIDKSILPLYAKAFKIFEARCKLIIDIGLRLRTMDNPFAKYPKCCGNVQNINSASRVPVPDERYDYLCEYHKPASKVPAFLNVVDIAGLVRGAAEGQGLGNAFLSHIKACDAIFHLCRAFDDEDVIHVDGDVNPTRDLETIAEELRLKDEEQLMQNIEKLDRVVNRGNDKKLKPEYDALMKIKAVLVDEKKHIRFGDWSAAEIEILNKYLFLTSKPALYLVNLSEKDYIRKKNKWLPKLKEWIDKNDPGAPLIPFSGALESKLLDMEPVERQAFLKENNITSALDKIIVQGYKALQLEYFFTAGPDEVKAWTIQKGTKAPQAAGRIHTDFEKGFIMAEVMHFKDFRDEGTEAACRSAGKYRQQGRNYVVEDGDIIFFRFNAGAGLKDAKKK